MVLHKIPSAQGKRAERKDMVNVNDLKAFSGNNGELPSNKLTVDNIRNEVLTISNFVKIENYYAVMVEERTDSFFFSPSAITKVIDNFGTEIIGNKFKLLGTIKIKGGKTYTPVEWL